MSDTSRKWNVAFTLVLVALAWTALPLRADPRRLGRAEQARVNRAIDLGAEYLRSKQEANGTWAPDKAHLVGHAALAGLTLLECDVPPDDESIQRAAFFVRQSAAKLDATYELSLAILFLDRLGLPGDRPLIKAFALRLIGGQCQTGGWGYRCPLLEPRDNEDLLRVLRLLEKRPHFDPILLADGKNLPDLVSATSPGQQGLPLPSGNRPSPVVARANLPRPGWCVKMENPPTPKDEKDVKLKPIPIPLRLRGLPAMREANQLRFREDNSSDPIWGTTDNSNTQFATLALWASRRYDIPMKRSLNLLVLRYRTSQNANGSWGYKYRFKGGEGESAAMTCAGLLGLAVGNGLVDDGDIKDPMMPALRARDPRLVNGLVALTARLGTPTEGKEKPKQPNLYFLWSVERVGVLFGLDTIGGKDWYRWASEALVANQQKKGNWTGGGYSDDVLDTCLALLVLKKANLANDLTDRLTDSSNELTKVVEQKLNIKPEKPPPQDALTEAKKPATPPLDAKPTETQGLTTTQPTHRSDAGTDSESDEAGDGKKGMVVLFVVLIVLFLAGVTALLIVSRKQRQKKTGPVRKKKRLVSRR